jgi:hypothetical protein
MSPFVEKVSRLAVRREKLFEPQAGSGRSLAESPDIIMSGYSRAKEEQGGGSNLRETSNSEPRVKDHDGL